MRPGDRSAIMDLISMYSYAYDENLMDEFMALFAEDAEVDLVSHSRGLEEIRGQVEERRRSLAEAGVQPRHHQTVTVLEEVSDGVVRGKTYVLLTWFHEETSELELRYSGVYEDEFVRTEEGWKFKRRFS